MREPGEAPPPEELPGKVPDELPVRATTRAERTLARDRYVAGNAESLREQSDIEIETTV